MESLSLVTGATGFLGSAVVRALLDAGRPVRALVRPGSNLRNIAGLKVELAEGRLEDAASLARAVAGCSAVFHVAADYRLWVKDPADMMKANVGGTRSLMQAAMKGGVERVVYTSSVAVLGHEPGRPSDERTKSSLEDMVGPYKRSKFLAEAEVMRLVREEGLNAVVVNPSTPVGPRDIKPTPTGRLILAAAAGRMPAYVETGLNVVHVEDVAKGQILALDKGTTGERYILGGDDLPLAEILRLIGEITGRRRHLVRLPRLPLYPLAVLAELWGRAVGREPFLTLDGLKMAAHTMYFSSAKAENALGYRHRPATEALADAITWFKTAEYCP